MVLFAAYYKYTWRQEGFAKYPFTLPLWSFLSHKKLFPLGPRILFPDGLSLSCYFFFLLRIPAPSCHESALAGTSCVSWLLKYWYSQVLLSGMPTVFGEQHVEDNSNLLFCGSWLSHRNLLYYFSRIPLHL